MVGLGGDALGARLEHLERARVGVAALALVDHGAHAVAGDGAGDEHHIAALAETRHALAAEGQRLDLQLELVPSLRTGGHLAACARVGLDGARAHAHAAVTSSSSSAFCAWRRFSAWSQMRWRVPYRSSAVISSPGWAGRS